jgi:hypothetical protein
MPFIPQGTSPSPVGNAISLLSNGAYNTFLYRETPYLPKIPQLPQQHVCIACALLNIGNEYCSNIEAISLMNINSIFFHSDIPFVLFYVFGI